MNKTIDELLKERSFAEARQQLQPWKEELEALLIKAGLLTLQDTKLPTWGNNRYTTNSSVLIRAKKTDVTCQASDVLSGLFEAAVNALAVNLEAKHQKDLLAHYDELVKSASA
jgi:hypothetical protein